MIMSFRCRCDFLFAQYIFWNCLFKPDSLVQCDQTDMLYVFVCLQNDKYTVGGSEMFDTLTDLVEHYKRKGIEEISGNWVHLMQVNWLFSHKGCR